MLRPQPVRARRDPRDRHRRPRSALPGVRFVFTAADLNPGVQGAVAHVDRPRRARRRRARRWPRARSASSATRSRSWSPRAAYLAEDAAELVDVDYEPLPAVVDYTDGRARRRRSCTRRHGSNVIGEIAGLPASRARRRVRRGRARRRARRSTSRRTRRCRWRAAASSSTTRARPASSRSTRRRSRRTRCACSARACSACPSTASASSCATPAAGSARRSWCSATRCA